MNMKKSEIEINFSNDDIDAINLAYTILQQNDLPKYLREITNEINNLNDQLRNHVVAKHDDLMSHAAGIEKLEGVLEMMCSRTSNLKSHTDKIRIKLEEPFINLFTRIHQLDNMQITCELLRKIVRINCLVNRLQDQKQDPSKASSIINELKYHFNTTDWKGIHILEKQYELTNLTSNSLIDEAWALVKLVKETNNQAMLRIALQVFRNLNMLTYSVNMIVNNWQTEFLDNLKKTIDISSIVQNSLRRSSVQSTVVKGPGRASILTAEQQASFRASFWTMIDKLVNNIESNMANIIILSKTLNTKRDMISQKYLIEFLLESSDENEEISEFCRRLFKDGISNTGYQYQLWISEKLGQVFREVTLSDESGFLKKTLENEYPKMLKLFMDLNTKLLNNVVIQKDDVSMNYGDLNIKFNYKYFKTFLVEYEQAFLSISLSKLFDLVQFSFNKADKMPTDDDILNFVKNISTELTVASVDQHLMTQSCKNVGKMVELICTKFEQLVMTGSDSAQIITSPNTNQKCNFNIINLLYKLKTNIEHAVTRQLRISEANQLIIQEKLDHYVKLQMNILHPLLDNITNSLDEIIATVHVENFDCSEKDNECSLMMWEFKGFIKRVRSQYLNEIIDENFLASILQPIINRTTEVFLLYTCLIRPLNDSGKQMMILDFEQFETSIELFCVKNQSLASVMDNSVYRKLRGLKSLISQPLTTIIENYRAPDKRAAKLLPVSYVLHHLFSRCPVEMKSPHNSVSWPIQQYITWLLGHPSESDRLSFIKGTLNAYANMIRLKEQKQYAEIYIHMKTILESALEN